MRQFDLKHLGGPYGDEMSYYELIPNKPDMTVNDLCEYAVKESNEWGYIDIMGLGRPYDWLDKEIVTKIYRLEYSHGHIVSDDIPEEIKKMTLKKVIASGGWSRMDYDLYDLI